MSKSGIGGSLSAAILAGLIEGENKDVESLVNKMRDDYQIKLAELTLSSNAKSANVTVSAESDDTKSVQLAEALQGLWYRKLNDMLDSVAYGRVAFEKVIEFDKETSVNRVDLVPLPYGQTDLVLKEGEFSGIELKGKSKKDTLTLPPEYSWWLALDAKPLNPYGTSRFKGAPEKTFMSRQSVLNIRDKFVNKFIVKGGVAHAPETVEIDGQEVDAQPILQAAYDAMALGGIMRLPNGVHKDDQGKPTGTYLWDFAEAKTEILSAAPLLELLSAMDSEQLLAFGIPPKTVIEGNAVGSFALITQQMLILLAVVEDIINQLVESFQRYVVDKVAEINGIGKLTVNFMPLTKSPDSLATEVVKSWLTTPQLSPLLLSGAVDISAVLDAVGIAVSADAKAKIESMVGKLSAMPISSIPISEQVTASPTVDTHSEAPPENLATAPSAALNGAQITSTIDVILRVKNGDISLDAGSELLQAVGLEEARAKRMMATVKVTPGAVNLSPFQLGTR